MIETVVISLVAGGLLIYFALIWESRMVRMLNKFPGPKPLPLIGNALDFLEPEKIWANFAKYHKQYGSRFRVYVGNNNPLFYSTRPEDLEKLLTSNNILEKATMYNVIIPWLGEGLLISKGKKWFTRRKQLTPAFHFKILDTFLNVFNDQSQVLVDVIKERFVGSEKTAEVHELVTRCALDIICETAMGTKLNCQKDVHVPFADATLKESAYLWARWTSPWLQWDFTWAMSRIGRLEKANRKVLHEFTLKVIKERKAQFENDRKATKDNKDNNEGEPENVYMSSKKKFAFLDQLLKIQADNPADLSDEDIRAETDTFMFEGHDTTSAALGWTIFLLALHPEHQAAVHAELDSIFGDDRDRPMTADDLAKMKFLECCVKESQRIYPSVPLFSRLVTQDFQLDENSVIPKGSFVGFVTFLIHYNPEIFPEPEEFRPSRFFPENCIGRHPYAYIPFSAGPRNCIGQKFANMEEKTVLAHVFRSFRVETTSTRSTVQPLLELIMRPKNGIHVKFFPR